MKCSCGKKLVMLDYPNLGVCYHEEDTEWACEPTDDDPLGILTCKKGAKQVFNRDCQGKTSRRNPMNGKKMAEIHQRFKSCRTPYLSMEECHELHEWFHQMYEYFRAMGCMIEVRYFSTEMESMGNVIIARGGKVEEL